MRGLMSKVQCSNRPKLEVFAGGQLGCYSIQRHISMTRLQLKSNCTPRRRY